MGEVKKAFSPSEIKTAIKPAAAIDSFIAKAATPCLEPRDGMKNALS
jgi:hypothetical protein